jgi:hypothetical protein
VWMQAVGMGSVVLENDPDGVAYFGMQDGPDQSEILFVGGARL